jgi:hypothetical protein
MSAPMFVQVKKSIISKTGSALQGFVIINFIHRKFVHIFFNKKFNWQPVTNRLFYWQRKG